MIKQTILTFGLLLSGWCVAQKPCIQLLPDAAKRVSADISFLASDDLEGREPGSEGADKAADYIALAFSEAGISPMINETEARQTFEITTHFSFPKEGNALTVENEDRSLPFDYFPLAYSAVKGEASGKTVYAGYGIVAPEKDWNDYADLKKVAGKIVVMDISSPDGIHPHSEYLKYHDLGTRVDLAREKGAAAVVFVNLEEGTSDPRHNYRNLKSRDIPVIFVQDEALARELKGGVKVEMKTALKEEKVQAYNVMGYVENGDGLPTIVIGAHYDHLGFGGSSSLYRGEEVQIHNGADDNASGTAGLLELARNIARRKKEFSRHNYLFLAFSGEEMGLLGSSFFVKHAPIPTSNMKCMLNMDMIGRLEENTLAVNGAGTSPVWPDLVRETDCSELHFKTSESGVGPSDHTSFYFQKMPVLHFFTGTHEDYHKPSDDFEKINVRGEVQVLEYILNLIYQLEQVEELPYTQTKEESEAAPRFTVTLGVLPDYMYSDKGMRIDGVTDGKPASKAGLKAGDVVVQMGDFKVEDMMSYMRALGAFKKGDEVELRYMRNGKELTTHIKF